MNNIITYDLKVKETWLTIQSMYAAVAKKYGISGVMVFILINIRKEGNSTSEIANNIGIEPHSITRHLLSLQENELAFKEVDKVDKRVKRYYLTSKGIEARITASNIIKSFNDIVDNKISDEESEIFYSVLNKISMAANIFKKDMQ